MQLLKEFTGKEILYTFLFFNNESFPEIYNKTMNVILYIQIVAE